MSLTPDERRRVIAFEKHRLHSQLAPVTPRPHHYFRVMIVVTIICGLTLALLFGKSLLGGLGVFLTLTGFTAAILKRFRWR